MTTSHQPSPELGAAKKGLENGTIRTFRQLFNIIPQTTLGELLDILPANFAAKVADPGIFTYNEMIRLAGLLRVDLSIIHYFIISQIDLTGPGGTASTGA